MNAKSSSGESFSIQYENQKLSKDLLAGLVQQLLEQGQAVRFIAPGISMLPFIHSGDILTISPLKSGVPHLGDVVAFIHPENKALIIHRVIQRRGGIYWIKGDNGGCAQAVQSHFIIGFLSQVEREGKEIHFGLGGERRFIALLSRLGILRPLVQIAVLFRKISPKSA